MNIKVLFEINIGKYFLKIEKISINKHLMSVSAIYIYVIIKKTIIK